MMYRSGFIGASTAEATDWVKKVVDSVGAKLICVPFAGSGRDIYSMAGEGRTIESWDTQFYSRAIVEGVFAASSVETRVDKLHYRKGWMYETRALKYIDERCAGFIDWVADEGTLFDKASLASAIVRSTFMGRMTQWYANIEQLYSRFQKAREYNTQFINAPGKFMHSEGSIYDDIKNMNDDVPEYDLVQIDPPKVVVGGDVYSSYFDVLNKALHGKVEKLPRWTSKMVIPSFRELMQVPAKRVLFMYVSGVKPSNDEVQRMLLEYGDLEESVEFTHHGRVDYGVVIRR